MPVIKSAKKKLRQDNKRTLANAKITALLKGAVKKAKKQPSEKTVQAVFKIADRASKKNIIHKNKVARLKSSLSKLLPKNKGKLEQKKPITKTRK